MTPIDKRAASAAYKERKSVAGVYALRCAASGETWVGQSPDVDKVWNRLVFTLRTRRNPHRALQAAWNANGAESFTFDILDRLEDEALDFARASMLKDRVTFWRGELAAAAIERRYFGNAPDPSDRGNPTSMQAQLGAIAAQIVATGLPISGSSSVPTRTTI